MSEEERKKIGQRITTRVEAALHYIELEYLAHHQIPDAAWIRNFYILFSFYTELLLKAIFVMKGNFIDKKDLENKLIRMGHDMRNIGSAIGAAELKNLGIKAILRNNSNYLVETDYGNFHVEDFTDIRYDFIEGKVRTLYGNEHELFQEQIDIMRKINDQLKQLVW